MPRWALTLTRARSRCLTWARSRYLARARLQVPDSGKGSVPDPVQDLGQDPVLGPALYNISVLKVPKGLCTIVGPYKAFWGPLGSFRALSGPIMVV